MITVTHHHELELDNKKTRLFELIEDISTAPVELIPASGTATIKRKAACGIIFFNVACQVEIRRASGQVLFYGKPPGGSRVTIGRDTDQLESAANEAIMIFAVPVTPADTVTCHGMIDFIEGPNP